VVGKDEGKDMSNRGKKKKRIMLETIHNIIEELKLKLGLYKEKGILYG